MEQPMSDVARGTVAAALLLAVCGPADAQFFRAARPFFLGGPVSGVRASTGMAVDLNGDGHLDLVVADDGQNALVVLLGDGAGSFGLPVRFPAPTAPSALGAADFNGDGRIDLAVAGFGSASLSLLLGDGAGGFVESASATVGGFPTGLVVADFDRDGKMDVGVVSYQQSVVTVLRGDGAGGFMGTADHDVGFGPTGVATADFNGDAWPDLAVTDSSTGELSVLLGDGTGGFGPRVAYTVGLSPSAVVAADLNGDGRTDLAVVNQVSENVSILIGNGSGAFAPSGSLGAGTLPNALAAADLDGDGRTDLAVLASNAVGLLLADGAGGFSALRRFGAGSETRAVVTGDFDQDGRIDILTVNDGAEENGNVTLLAAEAAGSFVAASVLDAGFRPQAVAARDLTGDGKVDLAFAGFFGVTVLRGDGGGGFSPIGIFPAGSGPVALAVGDLSQDGVPDLAVANEGSGTVSILLGIGAGAFAPPMDLVVDLAPRAVAIADLDGDGRNDLAVASSSGTVSVFPCTGPGTFGAPGLYAAGTLPQAIAVGMLNADVRPDLLIANNGSGDLSVLLGSGGGAFVPAVSHPVGAATSALALADLDADPGLDVAATAAENVTILSGDGAGGLSPSVTQAVGFQPIGIGVGDLNADGIADLAIAKGNGDGLAVLARDGAGALAPRRFLAAGDHPSGLAVADFNGDGRADVAVVSRDDDSVWVYLGASVVGGADLSVSISDSADPVLANQVFTYTITVTNGGPAPATAVQLRDRLPQSVQFQSAFPGPPACVLQATSSASDLFCQLGTIAPGASRIVTLDVKAGPSSLTLVDQAWVVAHSLDPDPLDDYDSETTTANPADISVSIADSADPVAPGTPYSYVITVVNHGPAPASFYLADLVPTPLMVLSTSPPDPACTVSPGLVECLLGVVSPSGSTVVSIDVVAPTGFTEIRSDVIVGLLGVDPDATNDAASETTRGLLGYGKELAHGSRLLRSLDGAVTPGEDRFLVAEAAAASYEVVVDATSGDLAPISGALSLDRLGVDTATVVQSSVPVGTGHSRSLRWENGGPAVDEVIRVLSTGCSSGCGPGAAYRIRAWETTLRAPRFNTSGTQTSILVLQNTGSTTATGTLRLWNAAGALAASRVLALAPRATVALNLATVAPGVSGSLTFSHTARHGDITGKTVSIEPATGFAFDTPLSPRPR
jgi:uncharacterized repeat protein (TIGR01451 family)